MGTTHQVGRGGVGLRSERGPVLGAVMLATGLVAIDSTIIATAVPSIVADLGGFAQFPWLFSVYLLAQAVTVPVYGKLADLFGRKPVILFGIGLFLLGSVLCGFAWSMGALIAFRAMQGLGAGAVAPVDDHDRRRPLLHRGAGQGPGLHRQRLGHRRRSSGPTLGGVFSEYSPGAGSSSSTSRSACSPRRCSARNFHEPVERAPAPDRLRRRRAAHRRPARC